MMVQEWYESCVPLPVNPFVFCTQVPVKHSITCAITLGYQSIGFDTIRIKMFYDRVEEVQKTEEDRGEKEKEEEEGEEDKEKDQQTEQHPSNEIQT